MISKVRWARAGALVGLAADRMRVWAVTALEDSQRVSRNE